MPEGMELSEALRTWVSVGRRSSVSGLQPIRKFEARRDRGERLMGLLILPRFKAEMICSSCPWAELPTIPQKVAVSYTPYIKDDMEEAENSRWRASRVDGGDCLDEDISELNNHLGSTPEFSVTSVSTTKYAFCLSTFLSECLGGIDEKQNSGAGHSRDLVRLQEGLRHLSMAARGTGTNPGGPALRVRSLLVGAAGDGDWHQKHDILQNLGSAGGTIGSMTRCRSSSHSESLASGYGTESNR